MVKFIGINCAREALADELHRQIKEDGTICYECYVAHRTLSRSILRTTKGRSLAARIRRDLKAFEEHRKNERDEVRASIERGLADIRAGRTMSKEEFLKKHPGLK